MKFIKDNFYKIVGITFVITILISSFLWNGTNNSTKSVTKKTVSTSANISSDSDKEILMHSDSAQTSSAESDKSITEIKSDGNIVDSSANREIAPQTFSDANKSINSPLPEPEAQETIESKSNIKLKTSTEYSKKSQNSDDNSQKSQSLSPEESVDKDSAIDNNRTKDELISENTSNNEISQQEFEEVNLQDIKPQINNDVKPTEPNEKKDLSCTLSIRCNTILNNIDLLDENKKSIIPDDGSVFYKTDVVFYEDESVFNVLVREMKKNKIHLEFVNTPAYGSAYIEGIGNIYEYDCGELSGWMYKVNGEFPNYGSSKYKLSDGDIIEWVYTCDLGKDVGGSGSARNGK